MLRAAYSRKAPASRFLSRFEKRPAQIVLHSRMAQMFPDLDKSRVIFQSRGEEQFYRCCRQGLPDEWRVYHSCTLSALEDARGLCDNEMDFVLYHPRYGIIAVEVKGGRIEFDPQTRLFTSINRYDQRFEIANPFKQVLIWKSRFLRYIRKQGIRIPVSHAVCFPAVVLKEIPHAAEIEPAVVVDMHKMQRLEQSLIELVTHCQPAQYLNFEDAAGAIDSILRGSHFSTRLHLRDYLDNHELRIKDIEVITETLITPIAGTPRLAIEGEAGTGKTMLAIMLARHFRDQGKRVLLLSSNPMLNTFLKKEVGLSVDVQTYAELGDQFGVDLLKKPKDYPDTLEHWTQVDGPEKLMASVRDAPIRYDVLVCDEAQDVPPFWWIPFELLLSSEEQGRFYLFFDRSQGVFSSAGAASGFVPEEVLPLKPPYFPLVHNYRNTREIAGFARPFRTGKEILQSHCGRLGYKPEVLTYKDMSDFRRQLKQLFRRLFEEEGIRPHEATLLSARAPFASGSTLSGLDAVLNYPLFDLGGTGRKRLDFDDREMSAKIKVSTISAFKGLETPVAVVVNLSEYNLPATHPIMSSLLYIAATRAKHMLYVLLQEGDAKLESLEAALGRVRQTGAVVIEGSHADYEFTGRVVHYNPDRVGWLKVDDPAFEKGSIMFFPQDIQKAKIHGIKLGKKLIFRPKVEGPTTIAMDLRDPEGSTSC